MQDLIREELTQTFAAVPFVVVLLRVLAAIALGALIGVEREWRHKPAGLKTHILVSLAACVFFLVGQEISLIDIRGVEGRMQVDPLRLIEAVTSGVAFLAAGIIFTSRGRVRNITTGASLWLTGAVGLACGAGQVPLAALTTVLVLLVLVAVNLLERGRDEEEGG